MSMHHLLKRDSLLLQALVFFCVVWPPALFRAPSPDSTVQAAMDGNPIRQVVHGSILALAMVLLLWRSKVTIAAIRRMNGWLWVLIAYILISACWSNDVLLSFKRTALVFEITFVGLAFLSQGDSKGHLLLAIRPLITILLCGSIIYALGLPQFGTHLGDAWRGLTGNKNALGQLALLCSIIWTAALLERSRGITTCLSLIIVSIATMVMSRSTTSLLAQILVVFALVMISCLSSLKQGFVSNRGLSLPSFVCVSGPLVLLVSWHLSGILFGHSTPQELYEWTTTSLGKDPSLTGRSHVWTILLDEVRQHPWLGTGYQAFWNSERASVLFRELYWSPSHGHNGYLDLANELGVVGLGLFLLLLVTHMRNLMRLRNRGPLVARQHAVIFIVALFLNASESLLFLRIQELWAMIFLLSIMEVSWLANDPNDSASFQAETSENKR